MALKDTFEVPIKCQGCGHETKQNVARLKTDRLIVCPQCGATTEIVGDGLDRFVASLDSVDNAFEKLGR